MAMDIKPPLEDGIHNLDLTGSNLSPSMNCCGFEKNYAEYYDLCIHIN